MAVTKRTRYEVLKRDNHACRYCGASAPEAKLTIDHVVPVALGGSDSPDNLVAACHDCNAGKSSVPADAPLVEDVRQDALRWSRAIEEAATIRQAEADLDREYAQQFYDEWHSYGKHWIPDNFDQSLASLRASGLPLPSMLDAVLIAKTTRGVNSRFLYFMGVCWRRVREIQETARQLIEAENGGDGGTD